MSVKHLHQKQSEFDLGIHSLELCQQALALLDYSKEVGKLYWRYRSDDRRWSGRFAGTEAGTIGDNGYIYIQILLNGVTCRFLAHRLIWVAEYDVLPKLQLDHIDQNKRNNRITNLRDVTDSANKSNVTLRSDNTTGHRGVSKHHGNWRATATRFGKQINIGTFYTYDDAVKARLEWEAENS